ncbi:MAG TPA: hypothetical protein VMK83_11040 [Gaiellaceae bacterium]|nr:hypothetical protein [Gaiellaceae bacterium]
MKGTLTLVSSIVVAALAVGAPAAFADPGLNGAPEMSSPTPDWFERAAAAGERNDAIGPYVDAFERPAIAVQVPASDWFERSAAAALRDAAPAPYVDAFERPVVVTTPTTSSGESSTSIAWGQIGIAFGVGLMLALGLMLAMRSRPSRPLAQ